MNVPLVTKDDFDMITNLEKNTDETKETIQERVKMVHDLFHNELSMENQLAITCLIFEEPCKYLSALIDQAFYVGYLKGYQSCVDEFIKESNLGKGD